MQGRNIPSGEYSRVGSPLVKCMAHMENRLEQDNAIVIEIKVKICLRKPENLEGSGSELGFSFVASVNGLF